MKFSDPRKQKPPVGAEMTVTYSMPPDLQPHQIADAICKFFESLQATAKSTEAVWIKVRCTGIPSEFEEPLSTAFENARRKIASPHLTLVVDNT